MKVSPILAIILAFISVSLPGCHKSEAEHSHEEHHKIVVTSPKEMDITITQQYVCQIRSKRHIRVKALQSGYLEAIPVKEGQAVEEGKVLFSVITTLYDAKLAAEVAEVQLAQQEFNNTERLAKDKVVAPTELALYQAKLEKAKAKMNLARAELNFTRVTAPFNGIIDRLHEQQGSLVKEGDVLTTLSDNTEMWVYFNVPEARYLQYMTEILGQNYKKQSYETRLKAFLTEMNRQARIELVLADGSKFLQIGTIGTIEAQFNNENGNISFRADFPNPEGLLRHGMTGNTLLNRTLTKAIVIPQRATFETLDKRYVYVLDKDDRVHQREIVIENELDDIYIIKSGLGVGDRFVFEGVRQVRDGDKREYEFRPPEQVFAKQQYKAE